MEFFLVLSVAYNFLLPRVNAAGAVVNEGLLWVAFVIAGGAWLVVHALKAAGLFIMAKKRGMPKKLLWCAFVPFANTFLMGELGGAFGASKALRHVGLYAVIGELLFCAASGVYYGMTGYAVMNGMYEVVYTSYGSGVQGGYYSLVYSGLSLSAERLIEVFYYLQYIFSFVNLFTAVFVYVVFFRRYAPSSYIWMVVLCAFVSLAVGPLVFAFRNRQPVDYDAFMRARYEQIRRQQQQYYGQQNPYGGYGAPYADPRQNPYQNAPQGQPPQSDDDPFGEFSQGGQSPYGAPKSGTGESGANGGNGADGSNGTDGGSGSGGADDGFFG